MSKERELIKDMKILLECTYIGGLQRNADVLIGRAIELLAQPEPSLTGDQLIDMWRDGYDAGARLAHPEQEQEPVAWMYDWENTLYKESMQNRITKIKAMIERPEALNVRPLYTSPPKPETTQDQDLAYVEASSLALSLHKKFYEKVSPHFELCDSTAGIISQIDNMVCTLVTAPQKEI